MSNTLDPIELDTAMSPRPKSDLKNHAKSFLNFKQTFNSILKHDPQITFSSN